jgi:hypothetical protein
MLSPNLQTEIERILRALPGSPSTKENIRGFLTLDPEIHRTITKRVFGVMNSGSVFAGSAALASANPSLRPLLLALQGGSKGLQLLIHWLALEEQKHGRLAPEVRRKVLDVLNLRRF